jgi:hypothetical protein
MRATVTLSAREYEALREAAKVEENNNGTIGFFFGFFLMVLISVVF